MLSSEKHAPAWNSLRASLRGSRWVWCDPASSIRHLGKDLLCFCFQGCGVFIAWSHLLNTCNETEDLALRLPALFPWSPGFSPQYCINYHECVIPALWRWRQDTLSCIENCASQPRIHESVSKIRHLTYYRKQGKNGHTCQKSIDPLNLVPLRMFILSSNKVSVQQKHSQVLPTNVDLNL